VFQDIKRPKFVPKDLFDCATERHADCEHNHGGCLHSVSIVPEAKQIGGQVLHRLWFDPETRVLLFLWQR
jgi:hypothetical protein